MTNCDVHLKLRYSILLLHLIHNTRNFKVASLQYLCCNQHCPLEIFHLILFHFWKVSAIIPNYVYNKSSIEVNISAEGVCIFTRPTAVGGYVGVRCEETIASFGNHLWIFEYQQGDIWIGVSELGALYDGVGCWPNFCYTDLGNINLKNTPECILQKGEMKHIIELSILLSQNILHWKIKDMNGMLMDEHETVMTRVNYEKNFFTIVMHNKFEVIKILSCTSI